ncbi:MAG: dihydrofolate reductase family protein [Gemmatimonadota bacterium]
MSIGCCDPADGDGVRIVGGEAADFVRELKKREGKGICILGGGELARSLLVAGVIDEIALNVHPRLLGSGVPLFLEMPSGIELELLECRRLQQGCVLLRHRIKG